MSVYRLVALAAGFLLIAASMSCSADTRSAGGQGGDDSTLCLDFQELNRVALRANTLSAFSQQNDAKKLRTELATALSKVEESAAAEALDIAALDDAVEKFDAFALRTPMSITIGQFANVLSGQAAVVAREGTRAADAAGCTHD